MNKLIEVVYIFFIIFNIMKTSLSAPFKDINNNIEKVFVRKECNCVCGASNRKMRVVGGNITKIHEFPWIAGIGTDSEFHCGGTLITKRHVLTAAHCLRGFNMEDFYVVFADHDRNSNDRKNDIIIRELINIYSHEAFDSSNFNNDIAILELNEPVEFSNKIQPACLPQTGLFDYSGKMGIVAGWGRIGERMETSSILKKVAVPVWSREECYKSGYGERKLSENMFCAGYPQGKIDACQGDSGGPFHVNNNKDNMEVIGIVSWGRGCARPNLPGVYTKISNYLDWIDEKLQGECLCSPPKHNHI